MSTSRFNLRDILDRAPSRDDIAQRVRDEVSDLLDVWGLDPKYVGKGPDDLDDDQGAFRYQYVSEYIFSRGGSGGFGSRQSGYPVQFKTIIYTTVPITDDLERYLIDTHNARLKTLFNTDEYEGYMDGFDFWEKITDTEGADGSIIVPPQDVPETGIGIPRWEVEVYYDDLAGAAKGYSLDFELSEDEDQKPDAPQNEVWKVRSKNTARNDYEIGPAPGTEASKRGRNLNGKRVYVAGKPVGTITSRGTVWMSIDYERPGAAKYTSRKQILDQTPVNYQALSKGSKLYKVSEDADSVYLVTQEPVNFDPTGPESVAPEATGERDLTLQIRDPAATKTTFVVEQDEDIGGALGLYDPIVQRDIVERTEFV